MSYGKDIYCADSLQTGRVASGPLVVLLACYRRQKTPRGVLRGGPEEQTYGFDLAEYIGVVGADIAVPSLPGRVRSELLKDDRVAAVDVDVVTTTNAAGEIEIVLTETITLHGSSETFTLTVGVSGVTVQLLGIS